MVQVIPGVGEELGAGIQQFAEGLEKFMKPNLAFQKSMQIAIGHNPQLAQQLTDLEANAPGTLQRMGFGALGDAIKQIPESQQSQFARQNRGEIASTEKAKLDLSNAQTGFDLGRLNETINFLKDPANKAVTADMILQKLTGQTADQRTITGAQAGVAGRVAGAQARTAEAGATVAEGEAAAAPAKSAAEIAKYGVQRQAYEKALADAPNLQNIDFLATARDFLAGKANGATISSMFNTPGAQEALSKAIGAVEEERQLALRENIAAMHSKADQKDMLLTREAFSRYQATKGAGTLDAWKAILSDPKQVEEIRKMDPSKLTQDQRDILHAASAQDEMQNAQDVLQVKALNQTINESMTKLNGAVKAGASQAAINVMLNSLNTALAQKGQTTGQNIIAKYGPKPSVGKNDPHAWNFEGSGLYFVDPKGNRVDDAAILDEPGGPDQQKRADAMRAAMTLQGMNATQRQAELQKMQKARPDIYNLVIGLIK